MIGDITVLGIHPTVCVLADIGMGISHGTTVVIPAEQATRSRDLWRAISQKYLFQLKSGVLTPNTSLNPLQTENAELRERVRLLEEENHVLREAQRLVGKEEHGKLDAILTLLQGASQGTPRSILGTAPSLVSVPAEAHVEVVEIEPPPFIPSKIRSDEPMHVRVQTEKEASEGSVTEAASRLRELRQRNHQ